MRIKVAIVVCTLFCFLVDPVLAASLRVAKVYRDYPGYINPAVCENPNVSKPPAAPAPQKIEVPLPVVPETLAGPSAPPEVPAPAPAPVVEPVTIPLPPATSPAIAPASAPAPVVEAAAVIMPAAAAPIVAPAQAPEPIVETAAAILPSAAAPVFAPATTPVIVAVAPAPTTAPPATAASPTNPDLSPAPSPQTKSCWLHGDNPGASPYLTLWAGMAAHHDTEIDVDNSRITFDTGLAGGAAVGYDFGPARLEIEGSYRHNNADVGDADLEVTTLMANVYADFATDGSATPYLGVGVGVADVDLEGEDDQVLAGQVAAGMLLAVTEKVAIDLGYRYLVADAPDIVGNDKELQQHTALIGVQIKF